MTNRKPWGVLVSLTAVTEENGLSSLLQHQEINDEDSEAIRAYHTSSGGVAIALIEESVRIGRLSSNDIQVSRNPCISSIHCSVSLMKRHAEDSDHRAEGGKDAITFSDFSRNGCAVNTRAIGKGRSYSSLASGDVLTLMDAGQRTSDYNVSFTFYLWEDFLKLPSGGSDRNSSPINQSQTKVTNSVQSKSRKRLLFLAVSCWNATAQVERVCFHSVEDFYLLDKEEPLGQGAFGKVYRAALRPVTASPPGVPDLSEFSRWTEEDTKNFGSRYIEQKQLAPSPDVLQTSLRATEEMRSTLRKRLRNVDPDTEISDVVCYHFAVKVIQKQRLWFEGDSMVLGRKRVPVSVQDKQLLLQLIKLETTDEDVTGQKQEEYLHEELQRCPSSVAFSSQDSHLMSSILPPKAGGHKERQLDDEVRRKQAEELLKQLSPQARQQYQRSRKAELRRKCEASILTIVRHPHVVRMYEVFDSPSELALVMEKATGGEVWDLLQPSKSNAAHPGGPLPEFLVKMIVTQVIEATVYLHSMGIIHRDLKLENLLLKSPTNICQVVSLQCEMLIRKLLTVKAKVEQTVVAPATSLDALHSISGAEKAPLETNPLSPLFYVHIPRNLWPVVQISDFGLSQMLKYAEHTEREGVLKDVYARNDLKTNCGTLNYSAPEVLNKSLRPNRVGYGAAVDMFSIGVIAFALLTNRLPYGVAKNDNASGVVIDYATPISFQRKRRCPAGGGTESVAKHSVPSAAKNPLVPAVEEWTSGSWDEHVCLMAQSSSSPSAFVTDITELTHVLKTFVTNGETDVDSLVQLQSQAANALPDVSPLGCHFLTSLLTPYPTRRMNAVDALQHPWLRECRTPGSDKVSS